MIIGMDVDTGTTGGYGGKDVDKNLITRDQ